MKGQRVGYMGKYTRIRCFELVPYRLDIMCLLQPTNISENG